MAIETFFKSVNRKPFCVKAFLCSSSAKAISIRGAKRVHIKVADVKFNKH